MNYTFNNKTIRIPDSEIEKNMKILELSKDEAIQMWLEDEGYLDNEEQTELDKKAKTVKIKHHAKADKQRKKSDKPRTVKVPEEKIQLCDIIKEQLYKHYDNVQVVKENKLFTVNINNKIFKIDVIAQRPKKS